LAHPQDAAVTLRDDVVASTDRSDALLPLAPESNGGFYLVPRVLE
jgi:aspartyl-tRNA(Asn)/glutamyl-tRNA(Gln) amidotransferase subunit C